MNEHIIQSPQSPLKLLIRLKNYLTKFKKAARLAVTAAPVTRTCMSLRLCPAVEMQ